MDVNNSIEDAQNTVMRPGYSFILHASEIHVSKTCDANFISSKESFAKTFHRTNADLPALSWFCHEINNQSKY